MVKRSRVLFAGQVAALEVEKFVDNDVEDIFDSAAVDSLCHRATMLKLDLDELSFYDCFTPVKVTEFLHIFAHLCSRAADVG